MQCFQTTRGVNIRSQERERYEYKVSEPLGEVAATCLSSFSQFSGVLTRRRH